MFKPKKCEEQGQAQKSSLQAKISCWISWPCAILKTSLHISPVKELVRNCWFLGLRLRRLSGDLSALVFCPLVEFHCNLECIPRKKCCMNLSTISIRLFPEAEAPMSSASMLGQQCWESWAHITLALHIPTVSKVVPRNIRMNFERAHE